MGTGIAALDGTSLVRRQSAPDPTVRAGLDGPAQAGLNNLTATADSLGFFYLEKRGAGVADREEQLGVHAKASSTITPSHQDRAPCVGGGGAAQELTQAANRLVLSGRSRPTFQSTPRSTPSQRPS